MERNDAGAILLSIFLGLLVSYFAIDRPLLFVFIFGLLANIFFYFRVTRNGIPDPAEFMPLYLFALGVQFFHFLEEYFGKFYELAPELLGTEPIHSEFFIAFNMVAYTMFLWGAIAWVKRIKWLMVIPLFFILFGIMFNAIGHLTFSIWTWGYFPGLFSAIIYMVLGPYLLRKLLMK